MSREKRIEEMVKVIDEFTEPLSARDIHKAEFSEQFAEALYNAGYRKQSEGEWKVNGVYFKTLNCSVCDYTANSIYEKTNYCPNCGAKMKGGKE